MPQEVPYFSGGNSGNDEKTGTSVARGWSLAGLIYSSVAGVERQISRASLFVSPCPPIADAGPLPRASLYLTKEQLRGYPAP